MLRCKFQSNDEFELRLDFSLTSKSNREMPDVGLAESELLPFGNVGRNADNRSPQLSAQAV